MDDGLQYVDYDVNGNKVAWHHIANLPATSFQLASMQIASCHPNEVFLANIGKLEGPTPTAGWQKPVYGTMIYRYWGMVIPGPAMTVSRFTLTPNVP